MSHEKILSQTIDFSKMEHEFFKEHQVLNKYPLTTRSVFEWLRNNIDNFKKEETVPQLHI